jgi:hypothetical protein
VLTCIGNYLCGYHAVAILLVLKTSHPCTNCLWQALFFLGLVAAAVVDVVAEAAAVVAVAAVVVAVAVVAVVAVVVAAAAAVADEGVDRQQSFACCKFTTIILYDLLHQTCDFERSMQTI